MHRRKIRLVSFASKEQTRVLGKLFSRMGCGLEIIDSKSWESQATFDRRVIDTFFAMGDFPSDFFARWFKVLPNCRALIIIDKKMLSEAEKLIGVVDEFILWPCTEGELAFRLSRLGVEPPLKTGLVPCPVLQEEFLKLNLVGRSEAFNRVLQFIKKVACYEAPILIEGETGTGKELVARAAHYIGPRMDQAFVPVNCGALPDNLIENELFGHKRGAYTDAREDHAGLVTLADGGTIFLDEIESLSEKGQVTLLRFLQDKDFKPLGEKHTRKADVRVITATNQPLKKLVEQGIFRQDLFFRLNVLSIELPALRDRCGDVELLANYFIEKFRKRYEHPEKFISPVVLRQMLRYDWPGNVRELENAVHRAFLLTDDTALRVDQHLHVPVERRCNALDRRLCVDTTLSFQDAKNKAIEKFEGLYLRILMVEAGGNVTEAAKLAKKERSALGKLLKKHDIKRDDFAGA